MRLPRVCLFPMVLWLLFAGPLHAGSAGSFRGTVMESSDGAGPSGWIFVRGRNGTLRRVEVAHAHVEYDPDIPIGSRSREPQSSLTAGTEVRVTAAQDKNGEWRATRVEILRLGSASTAPNKSPGPSSAS